MTSKLKTSRKWAWLTMLLIGVLSVGTISCDDNNDDNNTVTPEPNEPVETEAGWLIGYRTRTPQGLVWYMEVNEELPAETDLSNAVEIGFNAQILTFGSDVWTWNGDASTITKWEVDRTTLDFSVTELLSIATTGISGRRVANVFFSETQAFITNLAEGTIVEWNPQTMEIITVHNIDTLPDLGEEFSFYTEQVIYQTSDEKIMMPIVFPTPNDPSQFPSPEGAMMAIFDPETSSVVYNRDDRMIANHSTLMPDFADGSFYMVPNAYNSFWDPYLNMTGRPTAMGVTRINPDGSFDPNFFVDLRDFVDIAFLRSQFFVFDQKFVFSYINTADYQYPESYDDRFDVFSQPAKLLAVDLITGDVSDFTGFDIDGNTVDLAIFLGTVEGVNYFSGYSAADGQGSLLIQNGLDPMTVVTIHNGDNLFQEVAKLW
ncbi:MAG: hypothetical protein ACFB15_31290 [Cyclobacteriaceae bacterium]